jgi:hypothetical protein
MDKRERVINLVRELQKRTTDNGCTEQEALAAAAKVSKLMEDYQLSMKDVQEVRDDIYGAMKRKYGGGSARRRTWHETKMLWYAISQFTDTHCWMNDDNLCFFGSKTDCEIAFYLCDLVKNTAETEWQSYRRACCGNTDRTARAAFMQGFCVRLSNRLIKMRDERRQALNQAEGSRALVVVKDQVVAAKFEQYKAEKGMRLRSASQRRTARDGGAYAAGEAAGNRATITTGVGGSQPKGLLA